MNENDTYATRLTTHLPQVEVTRFLRIELFYMGTLISLTHDDLPYYLGRDESACDMVVQGETISRKHCVLQLRAQQVGLLDTSTNGTYVKPGRADSVLIHNDYYPLVGQGAIKLGHGIDLEDPEVLLYKVISDHTE